MEILEIFNYDLGNDSVNMPAKIGALQKKQ